MFSFPFTSKKSGSLSSESTPSSPGLPVNDHGFLSPGASTVQDDTHLAENPGIPGDIRTTRDRKGKGKARELSYSPGGGALSPLKVPEDHEVEAREAYLSPPLTAIASDKLFFAMEDISRVLKKGLSMQFTVDSDLESGSEAESSIAADAASPAWSVNELDADDHVDVETVGENVASDVSFGEDTTSSDTSSSSTPESYSSSRRATVGNTTLQDPGSAVVAVRFPSIFTQDFEISTLASGTEAGGDTPIVVQSPFLIERIADAELDADVRPSQRRRLSDRFVTQKSIDKRAQPRTRGSVAVGVKRKRMVLRRRREVFQEKGLSEYNLQFAIVVLTRHTQARDFFLIITLCFGMACAGILVLRPTVMALLGYDTLGGRLDFD